METIHSATADTSETTAAGARATACVSLAGKRVELWQLREALHAATLLAPLCVAMIHTGQWELPHLLVVAWAMYIPSTAALHVATLLKWAPECGDWSVWKGEWARLEQQLACMVLLAHTLVLCSGGWVFLAVCATLLAAYVSYRTWCNNPPGVRDDQDYTRPAMVVLAFCPVVVLFAKGVLLHGAIACATLAITLAVFNTPTGDWDVHAWRQTILNTAAALYTFAISAVAWNEQ